MNAPDMHNDWVEANQRLLVADFDRIRARLAGDDNGAANGTLDALRAAMPEPAAIDRLVERFGLSTFERDIVLLCAGMEMDSNLAALAAAAQEHGQRPQASFGLALATLADAHWSALSPVRPLRQWRLIEVGEDAGLAGARLRLDERILHFLAGINYLDTRLQPLLRAHTAAAVMTAAHRQVADAIVDRLRQGQAALPTLYLQGDDRDGQADIAAAAAAQLGLQLYVVHAEDVPAEVHERDAFAVLWQREAALLAAALLVDCRDSANTAAIARLARNVGGLLFIASPEPLESEGGSLRFTVNRPGAREQRQLWQQALGAAAQKLNGSLDGVASQYTLSARTILDAGAEIRDTITVSETPDDVLWHACRSLGRRRLDELAQRIEPASHWDDLILPEHQKIILRQVTAHVRNRLTVCEDWGFADKSRRGLGLSTLFAGESGTGKTMAAEVLAHELKLDLYRIDLSSVVSKYIGETEKNLRKVFDAAESSGAILLFDEADALFGKRSDVKDSHDRYANIEVSYLLQRMEAYTGLAILTTNLKTALDTAFQRRLRFVVQFTFPDAAQREAIWRSVFPAATPTAELDYAKLAQLQVPGGNIRNIALNAAFLAADDDAPVGMNHLLAAARSEGTKRERPLNEAEVRGWV
jgi:AAA+ superfamily predicted ATPase